MRFSRRQLLALLAIGSAAPVLRARGAPPPGAVAVHQATRNTLLGALGEALPELRAPPPRAKAYPDRRRIGLPEGKDPGATVVAALAPADTAGERTSLTLAEVGRQLRLANGVTGRRRLGAELVHLRAAPSAGALYADEVYLLASRVDGLEPGAYYYDVVDDALVPVASHPPGEVMARSLAAHPARTAPAWLAITSVFERYRFRYANRGYRYALIDAGHIGENFTLAARAAELPEQRVDRFADAEIEALLGIDGIDEAVCAVHALGSPLPGQTPQPAALAPAASALGAADDVVERYHSATRLVPDGAGDAATTRRSRTDAPAAPAPRGPERTLDATIRERRSTRRLQDRALTAGQLRYLVRAVGAPLAHTPALTLHVIVHRVTDSTAGHYRYDPANDQLTLVRAADLRAPLRRACLRQHKAGAAAAVFLPVADIPAAVSRDGERGYRHLLLDAGAAGQRLYLAAEAAGLTARNLAAFLDDDLNELLGLDGREQAAVHLTVAGHGD